MAGWEEAVEMTRWTRTADGWTCEAGRRRAAGRTARGHLQRAHRRTARLRREERFPGIVLGLSGGVDSALSAAVAVDALGPERVLGVRLPSPFTGADQHGRSAVCRRPSRHPAADAADRAGRWPAPKPRWRRCSKGAPRDVTEENLQARIRGLLLMGLSNKFGYMLLTTGNKSEMSVGYATLYGDMCGGFSVLKDIYKTEVYRSVALAQRQPARASRRARAAR